MKHIVITFVLSKDEKSDIADQKCVEEHIERCQNIIKEIGLWEPNMINDVINFAALYNPIFFQKNGANGLISEFELTDK